MYEFLRVIFSSMLRLFFRAEISGAENVPGEGGVIIAANHVSNWDPPVLATFVMRQFHFMAKQELFEIPVFGGAIRKLHAFPVKRGAADRAAIKQAIRILQEGACLGLFPEGTRSKDGELGKPEPGIALIALKAGVPVVPAAIIGTEKIFSRGEFFPKVKIVYGKPLRMEAGKADKEALQAFSEQIMAEVQRLLHSAK